MTAVVPISRRGSGRGRQVRRGPNPGDLRLGERAVLHLPAHRASSPTRFQKTLTTNPAKSSHLREVIIFLTLLLGPEPVLWAQPVPHHFTGLTLLPDQSALLSLDGSASRMFNLTAFLPIISPMYRPRPRACNRRAERDCSRLIFPTRFINRLPVHG